MTLASSHASSWTSGTVGHGHVVDVLAEHHAVVRRGERVVVGDEVVAVVVGVLLQLDVLLDGPEIVAQVQFTGGLDAGENAHGPVPGSGGRGEQADKLAAVRAQGQGGRGLPAGDRAD